MYNRPTTTHTKYLSPVEQLDRKSSLSLSPTHHANMTNADGNKSTRVWEPLHGSVCLQVSTAVQIGNEMLK